MEYDLLNNSLGSLAFESFCLGEDNLYAKFSTDDELLSDYDLYFNGLNSSDLVTNCNPTGVKNDSNASGVFNDLNFGNFTGDAYSLDYLLEDGSGTSSPTSDDDMLGSNKSSLRSPISSICSSVDDLSFDLLESLTTDEVIDEKPRGTSNFQLFDDMETPLSSPASSSDDDMAMLDLLAIADSVLPPRSPESSNTENIILTEHMYAKTPQSEIVHFPASPAEAHESENEFTSFDDLSPKSVDSGISSASSYDGTNDDQDLFFSELLKDYPQQQNGNHVSGVSENNEFLIQKSGNPTSTVRHTPYKEIKKKTPEQKQRKKKQNRNAASKYRCKKKEEVTTVFTEADKLEEKNKELRGTVEGLRKEIDYLKSLMLDVINARLSKKSVAVNLESLLSGLSNPAC